MRAIGRSLLISTAALGWLLGFFAAAWAGDEDEAALEPILITSTRTPLLIDDEPLRVEAVPADEIEENLTVQPGNLTSLLTELPGVRVRSIAPGIGGAGLQLRGMPARHTLVLTDGLPLLGAESDSLGLLQTLPVDLARVEVIKGAASALYGGSALGGVLNLVSQTPAAESSALADATSRGGHDLEGFFTTGARGGWSGTLTAGVHGQSREDVSGEGWADVVGYRRFSLRPRVWWHAGGDRSLFATIGWIEEHREGGTLMGRVLPNGGPFAETLHTRRADGGLVSHTVVGADMALDSRGSATLTELDRTFGAQRVDSTHTTVFVEEALSGTAGAHVWVAGAAFQHEGLSASAVPGVGYSFDTPGLFAQDEFAPAAGLKFAGSARIDANSRYGAFFSPRLSALFRLPSSAWSVRASVGAGYAAPTPAVDEIEATGFGSLLPLRGLRAERAVTESVDAKWADAGWDVNVSVFDSQIRNVLAVQGVSGGRLELYNQTGRRRAPGAEVLIGYVAGPLHVIGSWSHVRATEQNSSGPRRDVPFIPHLAGEIGAILENKERGRVGFELGYTGRQSLDDDPYRRLSEPFFEWNALAEMRLGTMSVFVNAINLTNVRQSRFDPLVRASPGLGGNPITAAWAPLEGRKFNLGVRFNL